MITLKVHQLLQKRALVTRDSAKPIGEALASAEPETAREVTLDFSGVDAMTPSFMDEVLGILENTLSRARNGEMRLLLVNPPTRLSAKFSAVARAHGFLIRESDGGAWIVTLGSGRAR